MASSSARDEQPSAYESLIRGDRHNPSYVDMSEPNYESIIDTEPEAYYVMPTPTCGANQCRNERPES